MISRVGGIVIRSPDSIYQASGDLVNGTFRGRWHFSFGEYDDPAHAGFGPLRVFNDDTLSPGAVWPLHYHEEIEVSPAAPGACSAKPTSAARAAC